MENRRRVTEEDLLVTEALIAQSYGRLKHSVVQAPSRALGSIGRTARGHPYATAATAVVAGAAVFGIIKMMASHASVQEAPGNKPGSRHNETCRPDHMHEMLLMIIPLVAPYLTGYLQHYLGRHHQPVDRD